MLFATRVYDPSSAANEAADVIAQVRANRRALAGSGLGKIISEVREMVRPAPNVNPLATARVNRADDLKAVGRLLMEIDFLKRRFILGKALSHARPGEPFDIVLSGSLNTA